MKEIAIKIKTDPTKRQKLILKDLVESYIEQGKPVSSEKISKISNLKLSPAAFRIELAALEEKDLIYHPYVSSGGIPTDKGFRHFVDFLMDDEELASQEKEELANRLSCFSNEYNKFIKTAVKVLSDISSYISLGTLPNGDVYHSGIVNLLREVSFDFGENTLGTIEIIDNFDQYIHLLPKEFESYKIYIGKENPIKGIENYGMIITSYELRNWGKGIIGIIGPKRISYQKIKSLLIYMSDFLSGRII
jgi:transcriptional regulator of heat shock response